MGLSVTVKSFTYTVKGPFHSSPFLRSPTNLSRYDEDTDLAHMLSQRSSASSGGVMSWSLRALDTVLVDAGVGPCILGKRVRLSPLRLNTDTKTLAVVCWKGTTDWVFGWTPVVADWASRLSSSRLVSFRFASLRPVSFCFVSTQYIGIPRVWAMVAQTKLERAQSDQDSSSWRTSGAKGGREETHAEGKINRRPEEMLRQFVCLCMYACVYSGEH
ncbi:unnamed protein product [Protopolystoma xenopodis]|uniref:Uncharacterized protein n=1 Tax=Protopolystoma xenopodis TaxID=117903 RepID=A0A3S5CPT1_9PLAT|nr:unnamed protein product [Protopolystoma xenopodis]